MRYSFAIAGLAVAAHPGNTYTLTATEEVTITSCAPTHTNCPYKSATNEWENWGKPADPTTKVSSSTWANWDPSKSSTSTAWGTWASVTTKPNGDDWNNWNGNGDGKKTTSSKPATATGKDGEWNNWGADDGKMTTSSKPSTATGANGDWNNWGYDGMDGKKTTYSKPATATGVNGDWNNWGYDGMDGKTSAKPATATGANGEWNNWGADGMDGKKTSAKPATATGVNGEWNNWGSASVSNTAACPSYTATAPPAWFSQLPSSVLSSLAAQWSGAPPKDWCYYSYSTASMATKTPDAASSNGEWNNWGSASATPVKGSATSSGPIAKFTGAANANAASFVLGGAAAIAAIVLV